MAWFCPLVYVKPSLNDQICYISKINSICYNSPVSAPEIFANKHCVLTRSTQKRSITIETTTNAASKSKSLETP